MGKRFVSIGEAMVELAGGENELYRLGFAGDTLNTAWYARALLGTDWSVDYVSALGDDRYSARLRDFLGENRIGTGHIQTIAGKTAGLYVIHQADGDRHFTYWRSDAAARRMADDRAALEAGIEGADLVYFSGITIAILDPKSRRTLLEIIAAQRARGATVAFDPNIRPRLWESEEATKEAITASAAVSDIVLPTYGDDKGYFGDASPEATAARYRALGAREVVVKDGSGPALAVLADAEERMAAEPVDNVVDATGAGDSFNAGYLAARLAGEDAATSLRRAHRLAAQVIGHHGALVAHDKLGA